MASYYLKYRPQSIKDLDLVNVRESIKKVLNKKEIPHAFLFAGPKGTGKTSAARLLAKSLNCTASKGIEPCNECIQCKSISKGTNIDIIEIDAASHRGIDDVRVLRDAVGLVPVAANKKVYIIDESHMLTTEASNALLKTLEEPPEHVVFILATTNPEKLISTIRSRVTTVEFTKATTDEIVNSLKKIVKGESLKIDNKSLEIIAKAADGSFRDAHKILEQLVWEETDLKNSEAVSQILSKKSSDFAVEILSGLFKKDISSVLTSINKSKDSGAQTKDILEEIQQILHDEILSRNGIGKSEKLAELNMNELLELTELIGSVYSKIGNYHIDTLSLITAAVRWCDTTEKKTKKVPTIENTPEKQIPSKKKVLKEEVKSEINTETFNNIDNFSVDGEKVDESLWSSILTKVKPINTSTETLLRSVTPVSFDGHILRLSVFYRFHKEKLEDTNHKHLLEDIISELTGNKVTIKCQLESPPVNKIENEVPAAHDHVVLTDTEDSELENLAEDVFGN